MLRRTGFARPRYVPAPAAPPRRVELRGVISRVLDVVRARPKTAPLRNRHLLDMAHIRPCLLRIPGVCTNNVWASVACHSNQSIHGKGGARKADDHWTVWGCPTCHVWLDQGNAESMEKVLAFAVAHDRQIAEWRRIAADGIEQPKDREAAQWAITNIERLTPDSDR